MLTVMPSVPFSCWHFLELCLVFSFSIFTSNIFPSESQQNMTLRVFSEIEMWDLYPKRTIRFHIFRIVFEHKFRNLFSAIIWLAAEKVMLDETILCFCIFVLHWSFVHQNIYSRRDLHYDAVVCQLSAWYWSFLLQPFCSISFRPMPIN